MSQVFKKYYVFFLCLIVGFVFVTRIFRLDIPKEYIFDEVYHAVTAKLILHNDPRAFEWWNPAPEPNTAVDWLHPPLAKYTQVLGMFMFGENSFGWRIGSVVFGVLVIIVTAKLALELFHDHRLSLLSALLASFDGLLLVQSRIAMNDIHVTFFILVTLLYYVRYLKTRSPFLLFATGIFAGLSFASKWSGLFVIAFITLWEMREVWREFYTTKFSAQVEKVRFLATRFFTRLLVFGCVPIAIYTLSYLPMFLQGKSLVCTEQTELRGVCNCSQTPWWMVSPLEKFFRSPKDEDMNETNRCPYLISHFSELHHQIWWYQTNLKATHTYQSRPLQWFLNTRPVWMYVKSENGMVANIYALGNSALFWVGDIVVLFTGLFLFSHALFGSAKKKEQFQWLLFLLCAYLMVWLPWQASPRIMFFYHYTPAVPLMSILLSYWLMQLVEEALKKKVPLSYRVLYWTVICAVIGAVAVNFILFYPHWTGYPVHPDFANTLYFTFPSWK